MRRLFWVAVGATATVTTLRKAREVTDRYVPAGARGALGAAAGLSSLAERAVAEFRAASAEREAELRADLLAGADLPRSRARVDAWRAERAAAKAHPEGGSGATDGDPRSDQPDGAAAQGSTRLRAARPGSAAAAGQRRARGAHRAEDSDDGELGYSFY